MSVWYCDHAWLGGDTAVPGVVVRAEGGTITEVGAAVGPAPEGAAHLRGLTLPAFANAHSHAFHRALRGRTQRGAGTFWTWREEMYRVAARLDPDSCYRLARAVYAELALAGYGAVGEFHYLHHAPGGKRYAEPNATGLALVRAAHDAGLRITLLDALYLQGGVRGEALSPVQQRFADDDAVAWAERVDGLRRAGVRAGAAIHSVRAVPPSALREVVAWADADAAPLHVHVSEQRRENDECLAAHGRTPTALLAEHGAVGPRTTVVHGTHLAPADVTVLGAAGAGVCVTPTTEADLADGLPPLGPLVAAGVPLSIGSDSHAVVDPFAELRGLELGERLRTERRGHLGAAALLAVGSTWGYASLGLLPDGGLEPGLRVGAPADLTTVALDSVRTAGWDPGTLLESVVFGAGPADVTDVVVAGRQVVRNGRHVLVEDVPAELAAAVRAVVRD